MDELARQVGQLPPDDPADGFCSVIDSPNGSGRLRARSSKSLFLVSLDDYLLG
jgi:hypothetical protein